MRIAVASVLTSVANRHLVSYPTTADLNIAWTWGSGAGLVLVNQLLTGIALASHYAADAGLAFDSVIRITADVPFGAYMRYAHANGASVFFIVIYLHIIRGIQASSFEAPREAVWMSGVAILLLATLLAFTGYVLPYGQMSYWGAAVISGLASVLPVVGPALTTVIWGGLSLGAPTLNRFASVHICLPFVLAGLAVAHLALLHQLGSSNPLAVESAVAAVRFHPAMVWEDAVGLAGLVLLGTLAVFEPASESNAIAANPAATPSHIVPEWYFLWVYGILRSIPDKALGVLVAGLAFGVLAGLPLLAALPKRGRSRCQGMAAVPLALTFTGANPISTETVICGQLLTVAFFTLPIKRQVIELR